MNLLLSSMDADETLRREAAMLGRYLVGRAPTAELIDRYVQAERRFHSPQDALDVAMLRCVRRRPWAFGPLDAACALIRPQSAMRAKALRMAAILEASPDEAEQFLPADHRLLATLAGLARVAVSAAAQLLAGLVLFWLLARLKHAEAQA